MFMNYKGIDILWLGHAGFEIISKNETVYIDPYVKTNGDKADVILITHDHYDHFSPERIREIIKDDTDVILPESLKGKEDPEWNVSFVSPGRSLKRNDITIEVVYAYNIGKPYHKKGKCLGYVIDIGGVRIYHSGDTDLIPEMSDIKCDIALLPVGGTYTMNSQEAAEAAKIIHPKIAIPMHYGTIVGSEADAEKFKDYLKGTDIEVKIMN